MLSAPIGLFRGEIDLFMLAYGVFAPDR